MNPTLTPSALIKLPERLAATVPSMAATAYDPDRPVVPLQPGEDPLVGRRIDHFEIRGILGQGGMGTVYLAHDLSLERPVALKVLRRDLASNPDLVDRLVIEARAQARLQHRNVVTIYYIGSHDGAPYFAMEYVRGRTVSDQLAERVTLPWTDALEIIIQTTRGLMAAHTKGVVHRDIKPSNLIYDGPVLPGEPTPEVKVADFGLAAAPGVQEEHFAGSPYYAAPEHMEGRAPDHRSDIYSLGVTFYELITGAPPFRADSIPSLMQLHRGAPRPPIPDRAAPWRLRQLVMEMMDPDPARRPWTYEELISRLRGLRPKLTVAGGLVVRGLALGIDLTLFAFLGQILAGVLTISQHHANEVALATFGIYYVLTHRVWGQTLGKRMLGLRIQGTTRAISVMGLTVRFFIEFWGPLVASVMINFQVGAATDLESVKDSITNMVGVQSIPILDDSTSALLRLVLVPNLLLAVPWLGGFFFALFDDTRQALHDRAARTRVVYAMRSEEIPSPKEALAAPR